MSSQGEAHLPLAGSPIGVTTRLRRLLVLPLAVPLAYTHAVTGAGGGPTPPDPPSGLGQGLQDDDATFYLLTDDGSGFLVQRYSAIMTDDASGYVTQDADGSLIFQI